MSISTGIVLQLCSRENHLSAFLQLHTPASCLMFSQHAVDVHSRDCLPRGRDGVSPPLQDLGRGALITIEKTLMLGKTEGRGEEDERG